MRVLLPPSESKRPGGGNAVFSAETLTFRSELGATQDRVRDALVHMSADTARAQRLLKLGARSQHELVHNLRLDEARGLPAIERYVGVLFDEIRATELNEDARAWIDEHVLIQSALFGLVTASDRIPPYRLSASTRLTDELGATLKRTWNAAFSTFTWPPGFLLDLRSHDYASLALLPEHRDWVMLDIVQRRADGGVRALNHFNKRAKGDLVRRLALGEADVHSLHDLMEWASGEGIELQTTDDPRTVQLVTKLGTVTDE